MRPLHILHVTPFYEKAWAYGGIPRVVSALAHGQARRGHRVTICATDACEPDPRLPPEAPHPRFGAWPPQRSADGVELRVFPNVSNALAYHLQFFVPLGLDRYLRDHAGGFDVAHLHGCHNLPGAIAAAQLRRAGIPYVLAPHGTAPRIERRIAAKWLFDQTVGRHVLPGAARVLAVTEAERTQLLQLGTPPGDIRVIPHPIDLTESKGKVIPGEFRRRFRIPWDEIVLYLGKLTPRKGLDVLVKAFASVRRKSVGLVIAGNDMGVGTDLKRMVDDYGLRERTLFTGLVRGHERLEALSDANVVTYPSQHEIFGLVPLEALLQGTPVIVSGDSGCGEVIGQMGGGEVVAHGNAHALGQAIQRILAQPDHWSDAANRAATCIRETYDSDAVFARLDELYWELLGVRDKFGRR